MSWVTAGAPCSAAAARPTTRKSTPCSTSAWRKRASLSVRRGAEATDQASLETLRRTDFEEPEGVPDVVEGGSGIAGVDSPGFLEKRARARLGGWRCIFEQFRSWDAQCRS